MFLLDGLLGPLFYRFLMKIGTKNQWKMGCFFKEQNVEAKGHSKGGICWKHCKIHMILLYFQKWKIRKTKKKCKNPTKNRWKTWVEKKLVSRTKFCWFLVDFWLILRLKMDQKRFQKGVDFWGKKWSRKNRSKKSNRIGPGGYSTHWWEQFGSHWPPGGKKEGG